MSWTLFSYRRSGRSQRALPSLTLVTSGLSRVGATEVSAILLHKTVFSQVLQVDLHGQVVGCIAEHVSLGRIFLCSFHLPHAGRPEPLFCKALSHLQRASMSLDARAGYMPASLKAELSGEPLVTKHVDKNGVMRQTGVKRKLKASQILGLIFQLFF